ncbi:hypothetical protein GPJ56_001885 [Histomonas meleagridis]|uniref:uncharacterized protein n=1 Tax=Histomonas meleagridis TaxID=135588 RepID=UPI0035597E0B|nr:hypothetical protein GPJ56_001885 [Histomonas meleagridis]KAH0803176.1 hypothetical protein GO595_003912 [Histomonas meleagridis]
MRDLLTFSVIPSIFGLLSHTEEQKQYVDFIVSITKSIKEIGYSFGRALFVIPEFRLFTNKIYETIPIHLSSINSTLQAEDFLTQFLKGAERYISQCPLIVKYLLQKDLGYKILKHSFFKQFIVSTYIYGFSQIGEDADCLEAAAILLTEAAKRTKFVHQFSEILRKANKTNYYDQATELLPVYSRVFYLTTYDVQIIALLVANCKNETPQPLKPPSEYNLLVVKDLARLKGSGQLSQSNDSLLQIHSVLHDLLAEASVIPNNMQLDEVLKSLVDHTSSFRSAKARVQFEIFQYLVEQYEEKTNSKLQMDKLITSFKDSLEGESSQLKESTSELQKFITIFTIMKQFLDKLSTISYDYNLLIQYCLVCTCYEKNDFFTRAIQLKSLSTFTSTFSEIQNRWNSFTTTYNYHFDVLPESILLHFMDKCTYPLFIKALPDTQQFDQKFSQLSDELIEDIDNVKLKQLLKNETSRFDISINRIHDAYECNSVLLYLKEISYARNNIQKVLFEIFPEAGENELFPTVVFLVHKAKPNMFISKTEYMFRAFQAISGMMTQSYGEKLLNNVVLMRQAAIFFVETIEGSEGALKLNAFLNS